MVVALVAQRLPSRAAFELHHHKHLQNNPGHQICQPCSEILLCRYIESNFYQKGHRYTDYDNDSHYHHHNHQHADGMMITSLSLHGIELTCVQHQTTVVVVTSTTETSTSFQTQTETVSTPAQSFKSIRVYVLTSKTGDIKLYRHCHDGHNSQHYNDARDLYRRCAIRLYSFGICFIL